MFVVKKRRQDPAAYITILVNRGGQDRAALVEIPGRVVRSPAKERYPVRGLRYDHLSASPRVFQPFPVIDQQIVQDRLQRNLRLPTGGPLKLRTIRDLEG